MFPIGRTILLWRMERKLSQAELARTSGIPRPNLSVIEQGGRDVTLTTLRRLALALAVAPGILADGLPPPQTFRSPRRGQAGPQSWTREGLDRLARYLAGEKIRLSRDEKDTAELLKPLVQTKMTGSSSPSRTSWRRSARTEEKCLARIKSRFRREELSSLLNRLEKRLQGTR